jgi:3'(2'), 5'-bisphosphate nucleotidase
MHPEPSQLLEPVLALAREAGQRILEIYHGVDFDVQTKADRSPLTAADRASHETIIHGLERLTPDIPAWSEESADIDPAERSGWQAFWLVDPLDGTKEFIKRNGEFTVNIALVSGHEPVLGVVHAPARNVDYYGCRGVGAFTRLGVGPPQPIEVRRPAGRPVRVVGSRSHRGNSLDLFLGKLEVYELVPMGSSLKLCLVATGEADVYPRLGPTSEWDTAAAQAVVECAGGRVVNLDGQPLRYNTGPGVLNPYFVVYGDPGRDWAGLLRATEDA